MGFNMRLKLVAAAAFLALPLIGGSPTSADVYQFGSHAFEFISSPDISWADAASAAASSTYLGNNGYLATPVSAAENAFLYAQFSTGTTAFAGAWLGGSVVSLAGIWQVGPLSGQQFSTGGSASPGAYANWGGIEPNNSNPISYAYMNLGGTFANIGGGQWADATNGQSSSADPILGYIIEYNIAAVPEPSTWAMMILGFAGIGFLTYRRRRKFAAV